MDEVRDGGYKSRKMVMAYVVIFLMTLGFLAVGKWPALEAAYPELCIGLLGAASIYSGGNAAVKWIGARARRSRPEESPPPEESR